MAQMERGSPLVLAPSAEKPRTSYLHLPARPSSKAPSDLVRDIDLDAQLFGERPDQRRVLLKHSSADCEIETLFQQLVRLLPACDVAHSADSDLVAKFLLDRFGE